MPFCLAALEGNFNSFYLGGRNVKAAFLLASMYFVCFPVSEPDKYNSTWHLLHGGRDALTYHFVSDSHGSSEKEIFLRSLKFLNITELERSRQIISSRSGTTVLWIRSMSLVLHCPRSWQNSDCDHKNASVLFLIPFLYRGMSHKLVFYWVQIIPPHCDLAAPLISLKQSSYLPVWVQDEGLKPPLVVQCKEKKGDLKHPCPCINTWLSCSLFISHVKQAI